MGLERSKLQSSTPNICEKLFGIKNESDDDEQSKIRTNESIFTVTNNVENVEKKELEAENKMLADQKSDSSTTKPESETSEKVAEAKELPLLHMVHHKNRRSTVADVDTS